MGKNNKKAVYMGGFNSVKVVRDHEQETELET